MGIFGKDKEENVEDVATVNGLPLATIKDELLKGARAFKAFEKGAEVVATLENLQSVANETKARVDDLKTQEAAARDDLLQAEKGVIDAKDRGNALVKNAKLEAEAIVAAGKKEVDDHKASLEAELVELNNAISLGKDELKEVTEALVAARADLEEVTKQIEQVKASVQSIGAK